MLSYLHNFSLKSLIFVLCFSVIAGYLLRLFIINSFLIHPALEQSQHVADRYQKAVWCSLEPSIREVDASKATAKAVPAFKHFAMVSQTILTSVPAINIAVYNTAGTTLLTSNNIGKLFFEGQNRLPSKIKASIPSSIKSYDSAGKPVGHRLLRVVVPMNVAACDNDTIKAGTLELFFDIKSPYGNIYIIQIIATLAIILLFLLLYAALFLTSNRAENIISQQQDEKLDLERAKIQAEEQNKQKSMFLANISHELRTPLNAIIGFSEIIKKESLGPVGNDQYKEYIDDINVSGVHLLSLINDILDYSKAEASKLDVEFQEVDLCKTATSSMRLVETRAKEANVSLKLALPKKNIVLELDQKRFKQVLLNMLSNAVKFTPETGEVTLQIQENEINKTVEVIVRDTGIGIDEKDLAKAMSPFGQIDSSLSRRFEGTGLGLPLSKRLTELMQGTFSIESIVDKGTTVKLVFPKG